MPWTDRHLGRFECNGCDIVPSWTRFYRKGCANHRQMKHAISTYPKHSLLIRQWQELFLFSKTCTLNPCLDWAYRMELLCNEITHHVPPCSLIDRIHSGVLHKSTLRCFKVSSVSLSLDVIVICLFVRLFQKSYKMWSSQLLQRWYTKTIVWHSTWAMQIPPLEATTGQNRCCTLFLIRSWLLVT